MKTHDSYLYALKNNKVTFFRSFNSKKDITKITEIYWILKQTEDAVAMKDMQHLHVYCVCDEDEKTDSTMECDVCNICGKSERI